MPFSAASCGHVVQLLLDHFAVAVEEVVLHPLDVSLLKFKFDFPVDGVPVAQAVFSQPTDNLAAMVV